MYKTCASVFFGSELSHKANLFDMHHKYARSLHLDEASAALERAVSKDGPRRTTVEASYR